MTSLVLTLHYISPSNEPGPNFVASVMSKALSMVRIVRGTTYSGYNLLTLAVAKIVPTQPFFSFALAVHSYLCLPDGGHGLLYLKLLAANFPSLEILIQSYPWL